MALLLEQALEQAAEAVVVLDDEQVHGPDLTPGR